MKEIILGIIGLIIFFICGIYFRQPMGLLTGGLLIASAFWLLVRKEADKNKDDL